MAWIDDRIWCHPKLTDLSDKAKVAYMFGIAYSSGFHTNGRLTVGQQKAVGAGPRQRAELATAGLWDINGDGETIEIHDWDEHNGLRDIRRSKERERKLEYRRKKKGEQ